MPWRASRDREGARCPSAWTGASPSATIQTHGLRFFPTDADRLAAGAGLAALRAVLRAAVRRDGGDVVLLGQPGHQSQRFFDDATLRAFHLRLGRHLP